jgi:putative two-component system response regulator
VGLTAGGALPDPALEEALRSCRILIVEDESANVELLKRVLRRAGFTNLFATLDPREAVPLFRECAPDLVLLDLWMPHLDGFEVLARLRAEVDAATYLPVLVVSADMTPEAKSRALSQGAKDFLLKPYDLVEVLLRIRNLLETRLLYRELQRQNEVLEQRVRERTRELEEAQIEVIDRLARAAEYRDQTTGQHTRRVGELSALLAQTLGVDAGIVELIRKAAPLHDVGKISLSDAILLKPGRLSPAEIAINRSHTVLGAELLSGGHFPLMRMAEEIALTHHERWDGKGYPRGLEGEEIPLTGRIVAVADVFDALIHARPYKPAWSVEEAANEIASQSGRQFDPRVADALLFLLNDPEGKGRMDEIFGHDRGLSPEEAIAAVLDRSGEE